MVKQNNNNILGVFTALCAYFLYSCYDGLMKVLGGHYSPFQISFFAGLFAFLPMVIYILSTKGAEFKPRSWKLLSIRAINSVIVAPSIIYLLHSLPLTQFYAIVFFTPSIITILSVIVLKEKIFLPRISAIIIGFIGVVIVLNPLQSDFTFAHVLALIIPITGGINAVIMRKLRGVEHPITLYTIPAISVVVVSGLTLPFTYKPMPVGDFGIMILIGVLGMASGLTLQYSYRRAEANTIAPIQYTQLIWAVIFGILFFNEIPNTSVYYGMPFILVSGLLILWRERVKDNTVSPVSKSHWRLELGNSLARPRGKKKCD